MRDSKRAIAAEFHPADGLGSWVAPEVRRACCSLVNAQVAKATRHEQHGGVFVFLEAKVADDMVIGDGPHDNARLPQFEF